MASKKVTFKGALGETLAGRLDLPDDNMKACALFAHCFTCSKSLKVVGNIAKELVANDIGVLRFDFTGLGQSEGEFANTNFSSNVDDLLAAVDFMKEETGGPHLLIGHSLGGAAVIQSAHQIPSARAVVTIGSPSDPGHVIKHFETHLDVIEEKGEAEVVLSGRKFTIKKQLVDDLNAVRMDRCIRDLDRALLVMHSPMDDTVGIENAAHIYKLARHPKSFISLDKADHLLRDNNHSQYAGAIIATWAQLYL
jgi:alpha/beta superfamily hydrolase